MNGLRPSDGFQIPQRINGQRVVMHSERCAATTGQGVDQTRTTAPPERRGAKRCSLCSDDEPLLDQSGNWPTNPRRCEPQPCSQFSDGARSVVEQASRDSLSCFTGEFHNTIVA